MNWFAARRGLVGLVISGLAAVMPATACQASTPTAASQASMPAVAALRGGLGPPNPFLAPGGVGAMHSDTCDIYTVQRTM